jgi:hypothetical protein
MCSSKSKVQKASIDLENIITSKGMAINAFAHTVMPG